MAVKELKKALNHKRILKNSIISILLYLIMIGLFYYGEIIDKKILFDLIKFSPIIWFFLYLAILYVEYSQNSLSDEEIRIKSEMSKFMIM